MSDWAEIVADECLHNCDEGTPLRGLIEAALRKAKADGMREAVEIADMAPPLKRRLILDYIKARAAEIEKGNA